MPCNGVIYKLWGFLFAMEQAGRRVAAVFLAARETLLKERSRAQASYPPLSQTGSPAFVPLSEIRWGGGGGGSGGGRVLLSRRRVPDVGRRRAEFTVISRAAAGSDLGIPSAVGLVPRQ